MKNLMLVLCVTLAMVACDDLNVTPTPDASVVDAAVSAMPSASAAPSASVSASASASPTPSACVPPESSCHL